MFILVTVANGKPAPWLYRKCIKTKHSYCDELTENELTEMNCLSFIKKVNICNFSILTTGIMNGIVWDQN